ncbi:MAG: rRNA maturation factor [Parcubacteria group bacterium Licking1014_17]|nr:MAG: rRNA maturation factor [Parcubacteria group bacterium Licking1014_17]
MIEIVFTNKTRGRRFGKTFFEKIIKHAAAVLGKKSFGISVNLVNRREIRALNAKYRGHDTPTDVLSFPLDGKNRNNAIIDLGDLFVCPVVAAKDAGKTGEKVDKIMVLLAIHGFLHLSGYDHNKPGDEKLMFTLQEKILKGLIF